jgi:hypothetical protein
VARVPLTVRDKDEERYLRHEGRRKFSPEADMNQDASDEPRDRYQDGDLVKQSAAAEQCHNLERKELGG